MKFLKFGKLFIEPANVSKESGWAAGLFAATHTPPTPLILILILILILSPKQKSRERAITYVKQQQIDFIFKQRAAFMTRPTIALDVIKEGLVSKHRDQPYQSGRSKHWIKVKNRKHEAFDRVQEAHRHRPEQW